MHGHFTPTEQRLTQLGHGVDLGDLDRDGDLDIFMTCAGYGEGGTEHDRPSKIYLNDGSPVFRDSGQDLGDSLMSGNAVSLHDIDTDGDLDAAIVYYQEPNLVYLNNGRGVFAKSDITIPDLASWCDVDRDGDVDLLVREIGAGFRTLLNDGAGSFHEHWRLMDSTTVRGRIAWADLDRDGDPDAVVASGGNADVRASVVWSNDGSGRFIDSGARLPITRWARLGIGDLNGDGYADVFVSNFGLPNFVWLNDGTGRLYDTGLRLGGPAMSAACPVGDLDGDDDLDVFLADFGGGPNQIWFNEH